MAKIAVIAAWLLGLVSLFATAGSASVLAGRWLLGILVVTHAIECMVFLPRLRRDAGPLPGHLARTFVFGILHVRELERTA